MADRPLRFGLSLETAAVATFDVVAFGLVGVLAGHASGALRDLLPGFGTVPGVLVFGYLWALVLLAMRWVLDDGGLSRTEDRSPVRLLARGVAGATLVGSAFVGGLGLVGGLVGLRSGIEPLSVALLTLFGVVGGALGGALVGFVFGLVDVGLARGADAVVDRLADRPRR
jgi:hypothetical protein